MKRIWITVTLLATITGSASSEPIPRAAQNLLDKRDQAVSRIDLQLNEELSKVKSQAMRNGDLPEANAIASLIDSLKKTPANYVPDPMVNTVWNFLGVRHQKINEFTFLTGGKVKCESTYNNATWRRLDENNILFSYGTDESHIVFRVSDAGGKKMSGFHYSGRPRHIQRVK